MEAAKRKLYFIVQKVFKNQVYLLMIVTSFLAFTIQQQNGMCGSLHFLVTANHILTWMDHRKKRMQNFRRMENGLHMLQINQGYSKFMFRVFRLKREENGRF